MIGTENSWKENQWTDCLTALSEGFFTAFFPWKFLSFHGIGINWLNFKTKLKAFFNSIYFGHI